MSGVFLSPLRWWAHSGCSRHRLHSGGSPGLDVTERLDARLNGKRRFATDARRAVPWTESQRLQACIAPRFLSASVVESPHSVSPTSSVRHVMDLRAFYCHEFDDCGVQSRRLKLRRRAAFHGHHFPIRSLWTLPISVGSYFVAGVLFAGVVYSRIWPSATKRSRSLG
jgi:hypothetical protein